MVKNHKKITSVLLGTIVEYYDYSLYGFSAGILAEKFFPGIDKISSLMYVFAIYALSYLAKPAGAIFFGNIGDKYGRKVSLRITMIGIALPTLTMGILPAYNSLGVTVLILCRFFQGFFAAGEYDGAAIYVIEHLGKKYQYTASALTRAAGVVGLLLGITSTNFFSSSIFPEWGWRIPFILSVTLAVFTIYYRKLLQETPAFIEAKGQSIGFTNMLTFIKKQGLTLCFVALLAGGLGVTYQISVVFMKQYLPLVIPDASNTMSTFSVIIILGFGISMLLAGWGADCLGKAIVLKASIVLIVVSAALLVTSIQYQLLNLALMSCLLLAVSVAPLNGLAHGIIIKAFRAQERYRGISMGHAIGSLLIASPANYVCLFFMKNYNFKLFPILYVIFFALIYYVVLSVFSNRHTAYDF